jgi:hypothetical protein
VLRIEAIRAALLDAATKAKAITVRGFSFDARGLATYFNTGLALAKR